MIDPTATGAWIVAAITSGMAVFERVKSSKVQKKTATEDETLSLAKASQERGNMLGKMAEEWKALLEQERLDHKKTRDYWHDENGKAQALLAAANLKVLELQDRPDLRDIIDALKMQGEAIKEQSEGIREILIHLTRNHELKS